MDYYTLKVQQALHGFSHLFFVWLNTLSKVKQTRYGIGSVILLIHVFELRLNVAINIPTLKNWI